MITKRPDKYDIKRRILVNKLFNGQLLNQEEKQLLDYHIFSSTYGTLDNRVKNKVNNSKSKSRYALQRLFLPLDTIKNVYPYFYEHKLLIPLLPIYRVITSIKRNKNHIKQEIITLVKI